MYKFKYTKRAQKDAKLLNQVGLRHKAEKLLEIIKNNPYQNHHLMRKWLDIRIDIRGVWMCNTALFMKYTIAL